MTAQKPVYKPDNIDTRQEINSYMVIGTMSSGKSTLLNSLIGFELFPSKNMACTAKTFIYFGNPQLDSFNYLHNAIKNPVNTKDIVLEQMEKWNQDQRIKEILIEGPLITTEKKRFAIIDTPGPNNSFDKSHEEIMKDSLKNLNSNFIIYVLNATQLGVDDDKKLLHFIKDHSSSKDIMFIVNKVDMIDDSKYENINSLTKNILNYLKGNGFENPVIFFVSALAAMLAMKFQSEIPLTKRESITYWRLQETLKINLADYNINTNKFLMKASEDSRVINETWSNSGIQSILNLL